MTTAANFQAIKKLVSLDNVSQLEMYSDELAKCAHHVDVNGRGVLHEAVHSKANHALRWLLSTANLDVDLADNHKETPLMRAAWLGNKEAVEMLLGAGAKVDRVSMAGGTALHFAYAGGEDAVCVIEPLLEAGCSPRALDYSGQLPSSWAAQAEARKAGEQLMSKTSRPGGSR